MSESITALIAAKVDSEEFRLPVFNQVALQVQEAIRADSDLKEIEALILRDQALASEILRVANSAFFAGLAKQSNVRQAISRIGLNRVFSLVMLASQKQRFDAKNPFLNEVMKKLWQHAAASAGGCSWVAVKAGFRPLQETAFLAGLLHDLGSLVVLQVLDEICRSRDAPELTDTVIIEVIDSLHTEYGHRVMLGWQLPPEYAEVARDHHRDTIDGQNVLLNVVRLVDAACRKVGIGIVSDPEIVLEALPEAVALGIKDVHLAELEIQLEEMVEQFG